jgi:hypothetical protein
MFQQLIRLKAGEDFINFSHCVSFTAPFKSNAVENEQTADESCGCVDTATFKSNFR